MPMACGNSDIPSSQIAATSTPTTHPSAPAPREDRAEKFSQVSQAILTATSVLGLGQYALGLANPDLPSAPELESQYASVQEAQQAERLEQAKVALDAQLSDLATPAEIRDK